MSNHDEPARTAARTIRPIAALSLRMVALFLSIALWSTLGADAGAALAVAAIWGLIWLLTLWGEREARLARPTPAPDEEI